MRKDNCGEHPKLILLFEIYVWIQLQLVTLQFGSIAWRLKKVGIREFVSSSFCDGYVIFLPWFVCKLYLWIH